MKTVENYIKTYGENIEIKYNPMWEAGYDVIVDGKVIAFYHLDDEGNYEEVCLYDDGDVSFEVYSRTFYELIELIAEACNKPVTTITSVQVINTIYSVVATVEEDEFVEVTAEGNVYYEGKYLGQVEMMMFHFSV